MNFRAVLVLHKTAGSAQTHKSISFIWIVWSTLYVYLCIGFGNVWYFWFKSPCVCCCCTNRSWHRTFVKWVEIERVFTYFKAHLKWDHSNFIKCHVDFKCRYTYKLRKKPYTNDNTKSYSRLRVLAEHVDLGSSL